MSRSRSPSPLNLVIKIEPSVTISEVSSKCTTISSDLSDQCVSSSTTDGRLFKTEESSLPISSSLSIDVSSNIPPQGIYPAKKTPPLPNLLPLIFNAAEGQSAESSNLISPTYLQTKHMSPSESYSPVERKRQKTPVPLPAPLKEKMQQYEQKMRHVRESIRQKRLQQGLVCHQCGRSYCRPYNLKRHIEYECGKAPQFPCPYCTYRARHKHDLKKHVVFKHNQLFEVFQAVREQDSKTSISKPGVQLNTSPLSDVKQKIRDQVNSRQKQNSKTYRVQPNLSVKPQAFDGQPKLFPRQLESLANPFGNDFYKTLHENFLRLRQSNDNSNSSSHLNGCDSDADGSASSSRSEGLKIKTTTRINSDSPDLPERDSGVHSTDTSPDTMSSCHSSPRSFDEENAADHSMDEDSNDGLIIDENVPTQTEDNAVISPTVNMFNMLHPALLNPYIAAFSAPAFNNNELMNKILLENPVLFQENLKNALLFMNQFNAANSALSNGYPV